MNKVSLRDSQDTRALNLRVLKQIATFLLKGLLGLKDAEIGFDFVNCKQMARINEQYLKHRGSTDVITFHYVDATSDSGAAVRGDIFVCVDEAVRQASAFKTTWQNEIVRYLVHGVLHLVGENDITSEQRRKMKRRENLLVGELAQKFSIRDVEKL